MSDWEEFEITEEDLAPKKRKRQTKEEALYGVFYEAEEEEKNVHKEVGFTCGKKLESTADRSFAKETKPQEESHLEAKALEEMYGKGFKMLQKSGFRVGQGLGKNEQGSVAPLQVHIRKKNEGLHLDKGSKDAKSTPATKSDTKKWKKTYTRPIVSEEKIKDLDKLLRQYREDGEEIQSKASHFDENTQKLTIEDAWRQCQQEVIETERRIRYQQDVLVSVAYDLTQSKQNLSGKLQRLSQLEDLNSYVSGLLDAPLDLLALLQVFQTARSRFPQLWEDLRGLERIALPMALERFSSIWQGWRVSSNSLLLREEARAWSYWLGDEAAPLFSEWERSLHRFLQTQWKPKEETGALIDVIAAWSEVIPSEVVGKIKGALVDLLRTELGKWEPTKETVPVHMWLQPWLGILDLEELWPTLLGKLARALQQWHPTDESAFALLAPWKAVVGKLWEPFCTRHILPKLAHALTEVEINPRKQDISLFLKVMDWAEVIPEKQFSDLLQSDFYVKWRQTLSTWLTHIAEDSLDEVQLWYEGWQSLVPKKLLDFSEAFHSG